jgi:ribosomal protein L32
MPKYYGCPCEGCGEPLTLKDDIVVCPDCGAPYHRTCYEKLGRCIHSPAHAAGYEWHFPYQDAELRTCPSCGERTLRSEETCRCCGAALPPETEADEQLNDRKAAQDEQHDGFDYERFYRQYEQQTMDPLHRNLQAAFGKDELIDGIPSSDWMTYIGTAAPAYLNDYSRMQLQHTKISLSFSALLFFATAVGVGLVVHYAMKWLDRRNPHTQRITIVSLAFCFGMAYVAEAYFGIADITGAYIAGIVLCTMNDASYVERRVDISNYIIFAPIFFASIGLKTDISGLTPEILLFCVCFVIVALITKIIGCGLAAKVCRFNWGDSLKVGVGMMTRGEVALIVAQKGLAIGVVDPVYFTAVILLIVVSSVATPLALKAMFTKHPPVPHPSQAK